VGEALPGHLPEGVVITDWLRDEPALNRRMIFLTAMNGLLSLQASALCKPALRRALFRNLAQNRLDRGVKLLSSAEFVITDRLHGHILCLLLGIPHIALDNSYGKLSGFISTWTKDCPFVRVAPRWMKQFDYGTRSSECSLRGLRRCCSRDRLDGLAANPVFS